MKVKLFAFRELKISSGQAKHSLFTLLISRWTHLNQDREAVAHEAALHGFQEPEWKFVLFTSQSKRAWLLAVLLNGQVVMASPSVPSHPAAETSSGQLVLPGHFEEGQVLDNGDFVQSRDAELSQQAIGRHAFMLKNLLSSFVSRSS